MVTRAVRLWAAVWPFAAFCVLDSSRWLLEGVQPETVSTLFSQALGCLLAAVVVAASAVWLSSRRGCARGNLSGLCARSVLGIGCVVAGPALAQTVSVHHVSASNGTLALALTPVVVGVTYSALGDESSDNLPSRLWPGLAGLAALLLLLPQPVLSDWRRCVVLGLMPLLPGIGCVVAFQKNELIADRGSRIGIALGLVAAAVVFSLLGLWERHVRGPELFSLSAATLDGFMAFLTLLALHRLGPIRWSSQFLVIPLLTLLQGIVFLHPLMDERSWFALGLLAMSSSRQVWADHETRADGVSPR